MSGLLFLYVILAPFMWAIVWHSDDWTPFWLRATQAALAALFWPALLVIFAIWMIGDGITGLVRMLRK